MLTAIPTPAGGWDVLDDDRRIVGHADGLFRLRQRYPDVEVPLTQTVADVLSDLEDITARGVALRAAASQTRIAVIRGLLAAGCSQSDVAALLNISTARVCRILAADRSATVVG